MSGENQGSVVDDFFSDAGGLIDQDSGSVLPDASSQQQNNNQLPNNNGQDPKTQQGNQPAPSAQPQQPAQPAQPFDQQFYQTDAKGNKVFDANKALDFVMPQNSNSFQYQGTAKPLSAQPQPQQPAQPQQPEKPIWQVELEEEKSLRETTRKERLVYREYLAEALQAGYTGDAAITYADRKADEAAEEDFQKRLYESRFKRSEESAKKAQEEADLKQIEPKSQINLAKVYNELGGQDRFNTLIFGVPSADGKSLSGGYGLDVINMIFDMQHQGTKLPSDPAQLTAEYSRWYTKFTSNENNLRFVVDVAKARLQAAMFPQIVNHIRSVSDTGNRQMLQANQGTPSGINTPQGKSEPDALDKYLYGNQGNNYDTV